MFVVELLCVVVQFRHLVSSRSRSATVSFCIVDDANVLIILTIHIVYNDAVELY